MRLICPNCGAQYEVPEDVIPDEGRDVQCSNCGDTWYQLSARMLAQSGAAAVAEAEPAPEPEAEEGALTEEAPAELRSVERDHWPEDPGEWDQPEEPSARWHEDPESPALSAQEASLAEAEAAEAEPEDAAEDAFDADMNEGMDDESEPEEDPLPPPQVEEPVKRRLDPDVSRVLREEAMRESALRSGRQESLETQTELGLEDPVEDEKTRRNRQAQERMARMRGEPAGVAAVAAAASHPEARAVEMPSRRGLLPDIEEVNPKFATGSGQSASRPQEEASLPPRRSGFSRGFLTVVLLMLLAILVYAKAPMIAAKLPQSDPYLSTYVAMVDQARLWLDAQAKALATE